MLTEKVKAMLIRFGWIDYNGREKSWFDWNKTDRAFASESPKGVYNNARSGKYDKDNQRVSKDDGRPFKKPVYTSNRGSRPIGQRTDPRRGSSPQGR